MARDITLRGLLEFKTEGRSVEEIKKQIQLVSAALEVLKKKSLETSEQLNKVQGQRTTPATEKERSRLSKAVQQLNADIAEGKQAIQQYQEAINTLGKATAVPETKKQSEAIKEVGKSAEQTAESIKLTLTQINALKRESEGIQKGFAKNKYVEQNDAAVARLKEIAAEAARYIEQLQAQLNALGDKPKTKIERLQKQIERLDEVIQSTVRGLAQAATWTSEGLGITSAAKETPVIVEQKAAPSAETARLRAELDATSEAATRTKETLRQLGEESARTFTPVVTAADVATISVSKLYAAADRLAAQLRETRGTEAFAEAMRNAQAALDEMDRRFDALKGQYKGTAAESGTSAKRLVDDMHTINEAAEHLSATINRLSKELPRAVETKVTVAGAEEAIQAQEKLAQATSQVAETAKEAVAAQQEAKTAAESVIQPYDEQAAKLDAVAQAAKVTWATIRDFKTQISELQSAAPQLPVEQAIERVKNLLEQLQTTKADLEIKLGTETAEKKADLLRRKIGAIDDLINKLNAIPIEVPGVTQQVEQFDEIGEAINRSYESLNKLSQIDAPRDTAAFVSALNAHVAELAQTAAKSGESSKHMQAFIELLGKTAAQASAQMMQMAGALGAAREAMTDKEVRQLKNALAQVQKNLIALSQIKFAIDPQGLQAFIQAVPELQQSLQRLAQVSAEGLAGKTYADLLALQRELKASERQLLAHISVLSEQQKQFMGNVEAQRIFNEELRKAADQLNAVKIAQDQVKDSLRQLAAQQKVTAVAPAAPAAPLSWRERFYKGEIKEARSEAYEYGRIGMSMRAMGRGATRLGLNIEEPLYITGDILRGVRGLILVKSELPEVAKAAVEAAGGAGVLAAQLGAAGLAVGVFALAMRSYKKAQEEARRATETAIKALETYARAVAVSTTEEAEDELAAARDRLAVAQETYEIMKNARDAAEAAGQLSNLEQLLGQTEKGQEMLRQWADDLGVSVETLISWDPGTFDKKLKELKQSMASDEQTIALLSKGLEEGAYKAGDFAEKVEKAKEALEQFKQAQIDWIVTQQDLMEDALKQLITPGDPTELRQQMKSLGIEINTTTHIIELLEAAMDGADQKTREYIDGLIIQQLENKRTAELQLQIAREILLPAFESAYARAQRSKAAIDDLAKYYEIAGEAAKRAVSESDPEALRREMEQLQLTIDYTAAEMGDLYRRYEEGTITQEDYTARVGELNTAMRDAAQTLAYYGDVLLPQVEAQHRNAEASARAIEMLREQTDANIALRHELMSVESEDEVLRAIAELNVEYAAEQEYLRNLIALKLQGRISEEDYAAAVAEATHDIGLMKKQLEYLNGTTLRVAREAQALNDRLERQAELEKQVATALDSVAEYQEQYAETLARRHLDELRSQEDYERSTAQAWAKHYADLAELDADFYEKVQEQIKEAGEQAGETDTRRLDEIAKFNKEMQRLAEDHQRKMMEIYRDLSTGIEDAVEDRSVSAAIEAIRAAKERTREENEQYDIERRRRWEDFQDRLNQLAIEREERKAAAQQAIDDLRKQYERERAERIADFQARLQEEEEQRALARKRQLEDWAIEDALARKRLLKNVKELFEGLPIADLDLTSLYELQEVLAGIDTAGLEASDVKDVEGMLDQIGVAVKAQVEQEVADKTEAGETWFDTLKKQLLKERQEKAKDLSQKERDESKARAIARTRMLQDYSYSDQLTTRYYTGQLSMLTQFYNAAMSITSSGLQAMLSTMSSAWGAMAQGWQQLQMQMSQQMAQLQTSMAIAYARTLPPIPLTGDVLRTMRGYQGGGYPPTGQWVLTGEKGPEMARFWPDGRWEILPPYRTGRAEEHGRNVVVNMPINLEGLRSLEPGDIEQVFEQRVVPRLVTAVRRAAGVH